MALGSQAIAQGMSQPLVCETTGRVRRHWSVFKEGLRFFVEVVQRHTRCFELIFHPDLRFT